MTSLFDPSDDFVAVADRLEPVTVLRSDNPPASAETPACRSPVARSAADASAGLLVQNDATWHLPAMLLPWPPRPGDVILDGDGTRWTVLSAADVAGGSRWRCRCRNLTLALRLDETIDIEQAAYSKGDGGAETITWSTLQSGVPARVQPVKTEPGETDGRRSTTTRVTIYTTEPLELDHAHRIKTPDGTTYRVTAVRRAERIDSPMEIDAVRIEPANEA